MLNAFARPLAWNSWRLPADLFLLAGRVLGCSVFILVAGCERQPNVKHTIAVLEKAFPPEAVSAPATGQPQSVDAKMYVQMALSAARSNDYATAVIMLKASARVPGLTPDQFVLTQQAKQALLADLQRRAAKNDAGAQAALQTIEQSNAH